MIINLLNALQREDIYLFMISVRACTVSFFCLVLFLDSLVLQQNLNYYLLIKNSQIL